MSLDELRSKINALDEELLELLNRRAEVAKKIGQHKQGQGSVVYDASREAEVFRRLQKAQLKRSGAFPVSAVVPVFREIVGACRTLQSPLSVAYLGPEGTFAHQVARQSFGADARYQEEPTIERVFDAVARKEVVLGVVPIENSTGGGVSATSDSLIRYDVAIKGEAIIDAAHCLLALQEDLSKIKKVYSHAQGLLQCRGWLSEHLPHAKLVETSSTSYAAEQAAGDDTVASVSSRLAADVHGLKVLRENIQDRERNKTRFVILAEQDGGPTGQDKTSIVFSTLHEKGALRRALGIFDEEDINLTRIESRPYGSEMWEYAFFADLEGHREDEKVARALEKLVKECRQVKVLGSYPKSL